MGMMTLWAWIDWHRKEGRREWWEFHAICVDDDGVWVGAHLSTSASWAADDIGAVPDTQSRPGRRHREHYDQKYGVGGWTIHWLEMAPNDSPEWRLAVTRWVESGAYTPSDRAPRRPTMEKPNA